MSRDSIACTRYLKRPTNNLSRAGYLLMNRSECEKDIGLFLIIIGEYLDATKQGTMDVEKTIFASVSVVVNSLLGWTECKNEIDGLVEIWIEDETSSGSLMSYGDDAQKKCLAHVFGEEFATMLIDKPFLNNWVFALNKIVLELYDGIFQCFYKLQDDKRYFKGSSLPAKIAWTIIDRSKCERSLANAILVADFVSHSGDIDTFSIVLFTLFAADHALNTYDNCQREIDLIKDMLK